ncbi:hypothetical protein L6475_14235 [Prevotella sp. E9-3]|uniref:lipocalin family protein n=1 Tax=Prevotella sp. E9-3 TaxID=2913621 RepID=UPI001EDBC6B0|nr:lipocalin family protein [Prevotella sp. E9-3]UKK48336.1 hypothetical protein L6475_14235 [Prevotella sp. E9-3]
MKKFFTYALSFFMMMSMSFSSTSCDSDDVVDTINTGLALYEAIWGNGGVKQLEGTAWYTGDLENGGYTLVLAFDSGNQGRMYEVENKQYTSAQYVQWSYNQEQNTLTIGSQTYTVSAFKAGQSLTMNISGTDYEFLALDPSSLASVEEVNGQGQKGSVSLQGEMWGVQINDGFAIYSFEKANSGNIYVLDAQGQVQQTVPFTYSISGNTVSISYQGGGESWTIKSKNDNQMVVEEGGDEYTYIRYTNGARSFDLF